MVLKSFAKINLSLSIIGKFKKGLHKIQSIYCLVDLYDTITISKAKNKKKDQISIVGPYSRNVKKNDNSVSNSLKLLRTYGIITNFYLIKINKRIPVFGGLGGGTSNAASVIKFFIKKKIKPNLLDDFTSKLGSDLRLFFHNQGFLKRLDRVVSFKKKHKLLFLVIFPNLKISTKDIYSKVTRYSKIMDLNKKRIENKNKFIKYLKSLNNNLQLIVEKKHPIIQRLLTDIYKNKGCHFSRMSGSGSACYGLFKNQICLKAALKKLRKKYPKFSFSIAKTI